MDSEVAVPTTAFEVKGEQISEEKVCAAWQSLYGDEPLPKIVALLVSKKQYLNVKEVVREHHKKLGMPDYIENLSIKEWGEVIEGCACVFKIKDSYLILIRTKSPHKEYDLLHELQHIHNGDVG